MNGLQLGLLIFVLIVLGTLATSAVPLFDAWFEKWLDEKPARWGHLATRGFLGFWSDQIGGYVHDTAVAQYIGPTLFHFVTGTWTQTAGTVAGTIVEHKAANAETTTINIPIQIPSNSVAQKGAYLKTVEIDYEIGTSACTSVTAAMNKITRGADTVAPVVTAVTVTQDLTAATAAATVARHKLTVTLTTPAWILNSEYYLLKLTVVAGAGLVLDLFGAVANYTLRM